MIYLILFSSFFLTANAKTINRQAYKVCKTNEEAYWNGSSAQCCDTTTHKLVKNYTDGVGENGYACCQFEEENKTYEYYGELRTDSQYTVIGAVNGSCCGGYTRANSILPTWDNIPSRNQTITYTIRNNSNIYYCGILQNGQEDPAGYSIASAYFGNSKYCYGYSFSVGGEIYIQTCCTAERGNPKNGECIQGIPEKGNLGDPFLPD